jgi:hypothetical protein
MGISDKMKGLATNVQEGVKTSSVSLFNLFLRLVTGFFLGLTLALVGQQLTGYGMFGLLLCLVVIMALITKVLVKWSVGQILIFDLICVLVAMLLRMYILVAP